MLGWAIERVDEARTEAEAAGEPFPDPVTETPRFIEMYNQWNDWFGAWEAGGRKPLVVDAKDPRVARERTHYDD